MIRQALLVAMAACSSSSSHAIDAHTDPAVCKANLEAGLDRTCTQPSDCVLVTSADCCGPIDLGIRAGTQAGFPALEATYEQCLACPPSGCAHATEAESGGVPQAGQSIVAVCNVGFCRAVVQ